MSKLPKINWNLPNRKLPAEAHEVLKEYIECELRETINKLPETHIDTAYNIINHDINFNNYTLVKEILFNKI